MASYDYNHAVRTFHEARCMAAAVPLPPPQQHHLNSVTTDHNENENDDHDHDDDGVDTTTNMIITNTSSTSPSLKQKEQQHKPKQRQEYLQCAVETMEQLSTYCPLTPLLWIQYAYTMYEYYMECCCSSLSSDTNNHSNDMNNNETNNNNIIIHSMAGRQLEYQILQLGMMEFPGAAILQYRTMTIQIQILVLQQLQSQQSLQQQLLDPMREIDMVLDSIRTTLQDIGKGSHRNEDDMIVVFYRLHLILLFYQYWLLQQNTTTSTTNATTTTTTTTDQNEKMKQILQEIHTSILQRSQCPMQTQNQNLVHEIQTILLKQQPQMSIQPWIDIQQQSQLYNDIEQCRQYEAKIYQPFIQYENSIEQSLYETDHIQLLKLIPQLLLQPNDIEDDDDHYDNTMTTTSTPTTTSPTTTTHNNQYFMNMIQSLCHDHIQWNILIQQLDPTTSTTMGMGLGSLSTAQIFIHYIKAIKQHLLNKTTHNFINDDNNNNDNDGDHPSKMTLLSTLDIYQLMISVYERGISECPCIELLWLSYIRELQSWLQHQPPPQQHDTTTTNPSSRQLPQHQQQLAIDRLSLVTHRAFRNCPYSIAILQQKFESILLLSSIMRRKDHQNRINHYNNTTNTITTLRPDQLMATLQDALDLGFLSLTSLMDYMKVFLLPIQIIKRHILILLSEQQQQSQSQKNHSPIKEKSKKKSTAATTILYYDDSEPIPTSSKTNPSKRPNNVDPVHNNDDDNEIMDEIEGLMDDIDDMYVEIEKKILSYMKKSPKGTLTTTSTEVCAMLHQEHAQSELLLFHPLRKILFENDEAENDDNEDVDQGPLTNEIMKTNSSCIPYFEKCIRCHNPPHPDSYILYIQYFMYHPWSIMTPSTTTNDTPPPYTVLCHIRQIRGLYVKALNAVGRGNHHHGTATTTSLMDSSLLRNDVVRDYESSLQRLCQDWLHFERIVGSPRSYGKASIIIEKKIQKMHTTSKTKSTTQIDKAKYNHIQNDSIAAVMPPLIPQERFDPVVVDIEQMPIKVTMDSNVNDVKRKHENIAVEDVDSANEGLVQSTSKKLKMTETESVTSLPDNQKDKNSSPLNHLVESTTCDKEQTDVTSNKDVMTDTAVKVPSKIPTIRVGNMDYPAHPYTIRVSHLSPDTEDMDLVDTFRPVCGAIVHTRIVRDKHSDGHSKGLTKGYGLIQFEQKESVEMALTLDDTLGIHEKLVKVERSHIPAVSLVPPGMHRVRPKGEGKVSKRNQKRSQVRSQIHHPMDQSAVTAVNKTDLPNIEPMSVQSDPNDVPKPLITELPSIHKKIEPETKPSSAGSSITAFRPRTVHRGNQHPKPRLKFK